MEARNLMPEDVSRLKEVFAKEIMPRNPEATIRIIEQTDQIEPFKKTDREEIIELKEKVDWLIRTFKTTFANHVFIDGKIVNLRQLSNSEVLY
jgi:hypothetical protein